MGLLYYLSYAAVLAAFAFVTLSLASGLLYVSELIEEHSRYAKVIGQRGIYAIIILHVLLYSFDSLPFLHTAFSIICHVVYLQNFSSTWPLISLMSPSFIASCVLVITDHFLWFFHFSRVTQLARLQRTYRGPPPSLPGFTEIASFFGLCVWLAPLFLFLSLSANDNALPTSTAEPGSPAVSASVPYPPRISLFRSILSSFDGIPRMRPGLSRRNTTDGLIAPHSPSTLRSPLPSQPPLSPSLGGPPRYLNRSPPRSPSAHARTHDTDSHLSPLSSFKLNTPPRRPVRRKTGEELS